MRIYLLLVVFGGSLLATACGPSVSVTRMSMLASRAPDCQLEYLDSEKGFPEVMMTSKRAMLGQVALSEGGELDPLSEENREIVRQKGCAMGGEAFSVGTLSVIDDLSTFSSVMYVIWGPKGGATTFPLPSMPPNGQMPKMQPGTF